MIDMAALSTTIAEIQAKNRARSMFDINTAMAVATVFIVKVYSVEYEFGSYGDETEFSTLRDAEAFCRITVEQGFRTTLYFGRNGPTKDY